MTKSILLGDSQMVILKCQKQLFVEWFSNVKSNFHNDLRITPDQNKWKEKVVIQGWGWLSWASRSSTRSWWPKMLAKTIALCWGSWLIFANSSSFNDQSKISTFCLILSLLKLFVTTLTSCSYTHLNATFNTQFFHSFIVNWEMKETLYVPVQLFFPWCVRFEKEVEIPQFDYGPNLSQLHLKENRQWHESLFLYKTPSIFSDANLRSSPPYQVHTKLTLIIVFHICNQYVRK